jgi:hypothetical protein
MNWSYISLLYFDVVIVVHLQVLRRILRASEIRNASCNVNRERDVLVHPLPSSIPLSQIGGDAKSEIEVISVG